MKWLTFAILFLFLFGCLEFDIFQRGILEEGVPSELNECVELAKSNQEGYESGNVSLNIEVYGCVVETAIINEKPELCDYAPDFEYSYLITRAHYGSDKIVEKYNREICLSDIENKWKRGWVLRTVIDKRNLTRVEMLIDRGIVGVNDELDIYGMHVPLTYAMYVQDIEIAKMLIEKGADVNARVKGKRTALMLASENGYLEGAELLLEKGADIDAEDEYGRTALMYAAEEGHKDIVELLVEKGADGEDTALMLVAVEEGHKEVVEFFIDRGADVDAKDKYEITPLMWAAREGDKEIVELLIAKGADVNARDNEGWTALMFASRPVYFDKEVVRLLIENGTDVNATDNDGWTALMFAAMGGYVEAVKLLVENGTDVNATDNDGWTALRIAEESDIPWTSNRDNIQEGRLEIAEYLEEHGAVE